MTPQATELKIRMTRRWRGRSAVSLVLCMGQKVILLLCRDRLRVEDACRSLELDSGKNSVFLGLEKESVSLEWGKKPRRRAALC